MANFYLDKQGLRALIVKIVDEIKANQFVTNDVLTLGNNGATGADHKNTWTVGVDGATIGKQSNQLKSLLQLGYVAAGANNGITGNGAAIALKDGSGNILTYATVSDIIGTGILSSSSYDDTTGKLSLNFIGQQEAVQVDLGALIDYNDIVVAQASQPYISASLTNNSGETSGNTNDLTFAVTIVNPSAATDSSTGLADAYQVKQYVDSQLGSTAISATGDNYITAAVDGTNNKQINVTADVQSLTATAGTVGVYGTDGSETTAPVEGTLSGTANSLADAADIAAKVKTYVDGALAIEAARSDAKNVADIAALNGTAEVTSGDASAVANVTKTTYGKALTGVSETNGVIAFGSEAAFDAAGAANAAYTDAISAVQGYKVNGVGFATNGWLIDASNINVDNKTTQTPQTVKAAIQDLYDQIGAGGSVSAQITAAINALDATTAVTGTAGAVSGVTRASYGYALTKVMETNGMLQAVDTSKSEQQAFDLAGAAQAAYVDIAAWTVNGKVLRTLGTGTTADTPLVLSGADIALTGYAKGSDATAVAATDTVNQAIGKLENQIGAVSTTVSNLDGAATAGATAGNGYNVTVEVLTKVNQVDGAVQAVGTGTDSSLAVSVDAAGAAAAAYTAAAAHTINGQNLSDNPVLDGADIALTGYTKPASSSAIAATDSVNAAIGKLEAKVDATATSLVPITNEYVDDLWDYVAGVPNATDPDAQAGS